jgi:GTP cyclohydrolase IA
MIFKDKEAIVESMLNAIGEDSSREGLLETPARVVKAWDTWFSGYKEDPSDVLKTFEDGAEGVDEMIFQANIPVYSHCEHHMAPFKGYAHIAYVPNGRIVGLSKLARVVRIFMRRLQVQERLTTQIAEALQDNLKPLGVGVTLVCTHGCMESRGVQIQNVPTVTSKLIGCIKNEPDAKAEYLGYIASQAHKLGAR